MARLILGNHPSGATGLFLSKPGVAVENTDPNDRASLLFSTQWGSVLNIVQTGVCALAKDVTLPNLGFRPFVRWEAQYGSGSTALFDAYPNFGATTAVSNNSNDIRRYDFTRYAVLYNSDTSFRIAKRLPSIDQAADDRDLVFRYVAFNFPANA